mmetsp:Transcript_6190/g.9081  ORF Transcript_6190/g.9081 Transcript_6190/m.9081 type:complete len:91 (-) Transcript_6190:320-592(-)
MIFFQILLLAVRLQESYFQPLPFPSPLELLSLVNDPVKKKVEKGLFQISPSESKFKRNGTISLFNYLTKREGINIYIYIPNQGCIYLPAT